MAKKINSMTESGVLAAVTVILTLIGVYVPLLGVVAVLLWPLPLIVVIVRHGLKWGIMTAVVSGILIAMLIEPMVAVRMFISFAPGGIALGIGYRRRWASTSVFTTGLIVSMISKCAALGLIFVLTGIQPFTGQIEMMEQSFGKSAEMYQSFNMSPEQIEAARENFTNNMSLVKQLLPLVVILMGVLDTSINFIVGGKVLKRLGHTVAAFPRFAEWRLSPFFAYLYGFSLIGMYWGTTRSMELLQQVSFNANMLATMAGILQGLVLYQCMTAKYRVSKFMGTIGLFVIFFSSILLQMLAFIGIFDMVFDYRNRFNIKA